MLSIAPEALNYIQAKNKPIFLDMPPIIGCCIHLRECPSVRFGEPFDAENYDKQMIQGTVVFVPHELPEADLTITLTTFLGFKGLAVEGWHLA